jgi:hypothetical protein
VEEERTGEKEKGLVGPIQSFDHLGVQIHVIILPQQA